ncbi:MAG: hypothetical protein R3C42_04375 [Parvularculaceae bacterium]
MRTYENSRLLSGFGRAVRDKRGIAATEFALLLPIITLLFFGMLEEV